MAIKLFELTGADDNNQFSPFCWAIRFALIHKGLEFETVPWRFTEKDAISCSGQGRVPVLTDGKTVVHDSWEIAKYLEATYPDKPSIFGGPGGEAASLFVQQWATKSVFPPIFPGILAPIHSMIADKDKAYFRETREAAFGKKLEELCPTEEARQAGVDKFREALAPMREMLKTQPFIGGAKPLYSDMYFMGAFMLAAAIDLQLLEKDDPVAAWRERMLETYGGVNRKFAGMVV